MNRLIDLALDKQSHKAGRSLRVTRDDDAFVVPRGAGARLAALDLGIPPRDNQATKVTEE